jgi:hypothetical protein
MDAGTAGRPPSNAARRRWGDVARLPGSRRLERRDGAGLVEVENRVELSPQRGVEGGALALGLRPVHDTDRPFASRLVEGRDRGAGRRAAAC